MRIKPRSQGRPIDEHDRATDGEGRTALVTGASSGIGRCMAELLAAKGFDVVLVARRADLLNSLAAELKERWDRSGYPLVADLSRAEAPADIAAELDANGHRIDFLVNNAGTAQKGRFDDFGWQEHESRIRVMGLSTLELTHRLLPGMVDRGWGRIVNVTSLASLFVATPSETIYSGVKAMVLRFSETIDAEFRGVGIRCTASLPGATETEIFSEANGFEGVRDDPMLSALMMSPATVARQAYGAVMMGRPMIVHGAHHKVMAAALQHAPLPVRRRLAHTIMARS
jgi:uncharacterized protein